MRLYHFCCDDMLFGVINEGLTRGALAFPGANGLPIFINNWQWLTSEPAQEKREWCNPVYSNLPYDRGANRVTVEIPAPYCDTHLFQWTKVGAQLIPKNAFDNLNLFGTADDYWIFNGHVKPSWISDVQRFGDRVKSRRLLRHKV